MMQIPSLHKLKVLTLIKDFTGALAIIILLLFILNNYIGYQREVIKSDGAGYYDYLPAFFIYGDYPGLNEEKFHGYSQRVKEMYSDLDGKKYNKFPCGVAILEIPFFLYAHLTARSQGFVQDGFSQPYQRAIFMAAIFYLFLALVFLRKLLLLFKIPEFTIVLAQLLVSLATTLTNYVNFDASFSHVYSFFAITAFLYFTKSFFDTKSVRCFLWACAFFGLIIILRQINGIIIFFIPFLAMSYNNLKDGIYFLIKKKWSLITGMILFSGIVFIQMYLWHMETGNFIFDSYQGEGFNFLSPAFVDILFSYQKGLFVYTPVLFIALGGIFLLLFERKYYLVLTWLSFFVLLTYILSSWHAWEYGCSYGARAFIDFYSVFFILFGLMINNIPIWLRSVIIPFALLTIPVNLIQTKQYKNFILHWMSMDKAAYWTVFLRQEPRFGGLLWKKDYDFNPQTVKTLKSVSVNNLSAKSNSTLEIFSEYSYSVPQFNRVNIIQVRLENEYADSEDSRMSLSVSDSLTKKVYYEFSTPLIHFSERGLNKLQQGEYNYDVKPLDISEGMKISLTIFTKDRDVTLKNIQINFLEYNN